MSGEVKGSGREVEVVKVGRGGGGRSGYVPEAGKFVDRKFNHIGRGRGRDVCEYCGGTCCSALKDMIRYFTGLKLIPSTPKVS